MEEKMLSLCLSKPHAQAQNPYNIPADDFCPKGKKGVVQTQQSGTLESYEKRTSVCSQSVLSEWVSVRCPGGC